MSGIRQFLEADRHPFLYDRYIAPDSGTVSFAKPLDRSVTGSMNDLVKHAKAWLMEDEVSRHDVGLRLNDIPFSPLKYLNPRVAFKNLASEQ